MADKKEDKPKTFDVTKPGKTPAAATSRPIIVGHGPMMKDPMVSEANTSSSSIPVKEAVAKTTAEEPQAKTTVAGPKVIKPPSEPVVDKNEQKTNVTNESSVDTPPKKPTTDEKPVADEEPTTSDKQPTTPSPESKSTPAATSSDSKDEPIKSSDAAAVDAVAQKASQKKTKKEIQAEEALAEQTKQIVSEGTYSLPIHAKRSSILIKVILFVVFLALIGVVLAIDAEVLDPADFGLNIDLPFDFL